MTTRSQQAMYQRHTRLRHLQAQVKTIIAFTEYLASLQEAAPMHTALWWGGDLPAHPDTYEPHAWQSSGADPVFRIWDNLLRDLTGLVEARDLPDTALSLALRTTRRVEDLLTASEEEAVARAEAVWRGQIEKTLYREKGWIQ